MERLKKKRSESEVRGDGRLSGKKVRAKKERSDGGGTTDDDAELEEFFAILKRLQAGFDYFQKKGADVDCGGKFPATLPATGSGLWDPAFELEDFKQVDHDGEALQKDGFVGFDLNADPEINHKSK